MHLLLLLELLVNELVLELLEIFKLGKWVVEYPRLQELVTQSLVGLAAHSVLVDQGLKYLPNVQLLQKTIASCQVYEKRADLEDFIVEVVRYVLGEGRNEGLEKIEKLFLNSFARVAQQERFDVRKDHN